MRVEATNLSFDLVDGREINLPASYGQIHDPSGRGWSRSSILFGPVDRTREPAQGSADDEEYFGDAPLYRAWIVLPPRSLKTWTLVSPVLRIWYDRKGTRYPGPYKHKFKEQSWLFGKKTPALLYKRGAWTRLDFPAGCTINWRGYVNP